MQDKIIELIKELNPYEEITSDTNIIEEGILDSLSLVILIQELESEFHIKISEDKLKPENFATVILIEKLILEAN